MTDEIDALFRAAFAAHQSRTEALHDLYQSFANAGLLNRVVVQRYRCRTCKKLLATVIAGGGHLLLRTEDYKYGRGMNLASSVQAAREKNTLDGERHWPGHTFDVHEIADWGDGGGASVVCRHTKAVLHGRRILEDVGTKKPGHPGAPSFL